jgi:hypothetical protein
VNKLFGASWAPSLAGGCWLLSGCYLPPSSDEQFEDSIVITSHDDGADFATFQTFFVRPGVRVLDEEVLEAAAGGGDIIPEALPDELAAPLVEETRQQLLSRGYREVAVSGEADLAVELVYARNISSDYYCYYWSDWSYWGYPGYNYYYPYSCDTVTWRSGMLATNVIDLTLVAPAGAAPVDQNTTLSRDSFLRGLWFSGIYGTEIETAAYVAARAVQGIDQAFEQSPYFSSLPRGQ